MSYELEVNGTTYYFTTAEAKNAVNNARGNSSKLNLIEQYTNEGICATNENELVVLEEDTSAQETSSSKRAGGGHQISESGSTTTEEEEAGQCLEGFDNDSYTAYAESIGLSALTDDSGIDDLIAILDEIEASIDEVNSKIDSLNTDDPDEMAEVLDQVTNMSVAISGLAESAGAEISNKNGVVGKTIGAIAGGALAVGVPAYCIVTSTAAIGTAIASGAGTVAAVASAVPVAGWVVAGIAAGVGIVAGVAAYNANKENKKLEQLQEDINTAAQNIDEAYAKAQEEVQNSTNGLVEEANSDLKDFLSGFSFDDIEDVDSIDENLDKILEWQGKLQPYFDVCQKYGIEVDGLEELMGILGSGDDSLKLAQDYFDGYVEQVEIGIEGDAIADTESLNALYENLEGLLESAEEKGLDTSKLEALLEKIKSANQSSVDEAAQSYASSETSSAQEAQDAIDSVNTASSGVSSASTSYTTDTSSLDETAQAILERAQTDIDAYLAAISTSGLSLTELEALYNSVYSVYEEYSVIEGLDRSGFETVFANIRAAQQAIIDDTAATYTSTVSSSTSTSELQSLYKQLVSYINTYGCSCNCQCLHDCCQHVHEKAQEIVDKKVVEYVPVVKTITTTEEAREAIDNITVEINNSTSLDVDVSGLEAAIAELTQKVEDLSNQEVNVTVNVDNTIVNDVTVDNDVAVDNDVTIETPQIPVEEPAEEPVEEPVEDDVIEDNPNDDIKPQTDIGAEEETVVEETVVEETVVEEKTTEETVVEETVEEVAAEEVTCSSEEITNNDMGVTIDEDDDTSSIAAAALVEKAEEAAETAEAAAEAAASADTVEEAEAAAKDASAAAASAETSASITSVISDNTNDDVSEAKESAKEAEQAAEEAKESAEEAKEESKAEENDDDIEITAEED